ncbi:hypothetical protein RHGRI_033457 [Rhododendron griersonianum]|uniref:RNA-binding protein 48 n=1 Tax=Rhododendron griersonianum TaxID=479676 RepID=A0AAV6I0L8_9ERIC|nr:hypothetical protein RHGRI_033457 [Rhododendron griersonianum]
MPRYKDEPPAIRVYTVCDESKYLIVKNVPALGCGDELSRLFGSYGDIEECKPMDYEDCEPFTDVYWVKFRQVNNARFAKRKLDEFVFLGNRLQVSYAPQYESLSDTKEKLEGRRKEVLARLSRKPCQYLNDFSWEIQWVYGSYPRNTGEFQHISHNADSSSMTRVTSDKDYFPTQSMNQTVQFVRDKLNKIQSSTQNIETGPSKKPRVDNRRRI